MAALPGDDRKWLGPLSGDGGPGSTYPADTQEACSRALVPVKKISPISIAVGATVAVVSLAGGIGAGYLIWGRKKPSGLGS
ncbi:MAG: TRAPP III-specific subunit 85 family protein [Holosporales bacterium]|nr:TRAPP III-specific subunit 85 family protein [Holosporales bacterium]